ncbi:EamA/RhaT family transporter, partial [Tritonibacter sp. SIMBA_163]
LGEKWEPRGWELWVLFGRAAAQKLGAAFCGVMMLRSGEVSAVAALRYTGLVWALVLGWVVVGECPSGLRLLGAGFVVAAGLFTLV